MENKPLEFSKYSSIWVDHWGAYRNHKETMAHLGMALYLAGSIGFVLKAKEIVNAIGFLPSLLFGILVTLAAFTFVCWQFAHREWAARILDAWSDVSTGILLGIVNDAELRSDKATLAPYEREFPGIFTDKAREQREKDKFWSFKGIAGSVIPNFLVLSCAAVAAILALSKVGVEALMNGWPHIQLGTQSAMGSTIITIISGVLCGVVWSLALCGLVALLVFILWQLYKCLLRGK